MIINSRSTFVIYLLFCTSSMTSLKKRIWAFYNLIYGIALTPGFTTRSPISNSSSFTLKIYQHLMFDLTPTKRLLNDSSKVSIHRFNVNFFYISQTYLLFCRMKSIDLWIIRIERHVFDGVTISIFAYFLPYICLVFAPSQ